MGSCLIPEDNQQQQVESGEEAQSSGVVGTEVREVAGDRDDSQTT